MRDIENTGKHHSKPPCEKPKKSYSEPGTEHSGRSGTSPTTETMCLALFTRLNALYRHKAAAEFRAKLPDGSPTPEFRLWCQKLSHLTPEQFRQGVELLERQEAEARRTGDDTWPPSYAGFLGLATMRTKPRSTVEELPPVMDRAEANKRLAEIMDSIAIR